MKKELITLFTENGENFDIENWNVYPRPQMKRDSFLCLNGQWDFALSETPKAPQKFNQKITVPFAPQSVLSGVFKNIPDNLYLIYRKEFSLPDGFNMGRVLLHFGAVDQLATVIINGTTLPTHTGGYEPFYFDITHYLKQSNTVTVIVKDNLDSFVLPYGKQKHKRGGMWYTPVSGIWQTVWLESVPNEYIKSVKIQADDKKAEVFVTGVTDGVLRLDGRSFEVKNGKAEIELENPLLWSPETPNIYNFTIETAEDKVESYLAFRKIESRVVNGVPRLCLNGKPYFFHGLLDQGYFPDGIFTPASPKEFKNDILSMKALGFNMLRKHIKIEPQIFYYYCDIYGMTVFQDFVNNGRYSFFRDTALPTVFMKKFPDKLLHTNKESRKAFREHMISAVNTLYNHPSIVYWTIFNEGWGQFDSANMYKLLKTVDSSRIIDTTSGWFKSVVSDVESEHVYFKPVKLKKSDKPIVLSEFGGYSYKPENHVANPHDTYGYRFFKEQPDFMNALEKLYKDEVIPLIKKGLCAAVYTQVSDVEDETNGLLSYDRKVLKVDKEKMLGIAEKIYNEIKEEA
ncbi:MAG: glycoside hydrolase family 2 [Clostridia bacterium]|nr:glycoside hydrolase family 2 [Clostridia bacterium]MBR6741275.1 glycoside hydrolase family 2 [Clostridia bacterium]